MPTQLIRLQLLDGDPEGLRTAAIAGRTTLLFACPWTDLKALLTREEAKKPGVYVLSGFSAATPDDPAEPTVYVGECDSLAERFGKTHHKQDAAEWVEVFLATTSDGTFNKAHARLAEHLLVKAARAAKRAEVANGGTSEGRLDEGDRAFAEQFVENVVILAQTLGLSVFRAPISATAPVLPTSEGAAPLAVFEFKYTGLPISAHMVVDGKSFIIKAGSQARAADMAGLGDGYRQLREKARKDGILVPDQAEGYERFTADLPTQSASAAGSVIYGSACAGPIAWFHSETKQSLKEWQAAQTEAKG